MRAIWAIVESVSQGHRFGHIDDIRHQASQLGRITFVICPPTIGITGIVARSETAEVAVHGAFDGDVGRDGGFDGVPFSEGYGVAGGNHGGLNPVRGEVGGLGVNGGVRVVGALSGGV